MKPQDLSPYLKPGYYQMPRRLLTTLGTVKRFVPRGNATKIPDTVVGRQRVINVIQHKKPTKEPIEKPSVVFTLTVNLV